MSEAINPFLVCGVTDTSNGSIYDAINTGEVTCEYDASYPERKGDRERPMRLLRRVSISNLVDFFSPQGRRRRSTVWHISQLSGRTNMGRTRTNRGRTEGEQTASVGHRRTSSGLRPDFGFPAQEPRSVKPSGRPASPQRGDKLGQEFRNGRSLEQIERRVPQFLPCLE